MDTLVFEHKVCNWQSVTVNKSNDKASLRFRAERIHSFLSRRITATAPYRAKSQCSSQLEFFLIPPSTDSKRRGFLFLDLQTQTTVKHLTPNRRRRTWWLRWGLWTNPHQLTLLTSPESEKLGVRAQSACGSEPDILQSVPLSLQDKPRLSGDIPCPTKWTSKTGTAQCWPLPVSSDVRLVADTS